MDSGPKLVEGSPDQMLVLSFGLRLRQKTQLNAQAQGLYQSLGVIGGSKFFLPTHKKCHANFLSERVILKFIFLYEI